MKRLFTLVFILSINSIFAQFSKGEVYNFSVGDVHQKLYSASGSYPMVEIDTVLTKVVDLQTSSIVYTIKRRQINGGSTLSYTDIIDTLEIYCLYCQPSHFSYNSCLTPYMSTLTNSCGFNVQRLNSDADTSCFEFPNWHSDLYVGLGGPYYSVSDFSGPSYFSKTLVYSNTQAYGICGNYYSFLDFQESELNKIQLKSTVVNEVVEIVGVNSPTKIHIFTLNGTLLKTSSIDKEYSKINIEDLANGNYLVFIESSDLAVFKFVKL